MPYVEPQFPSRITKSHYSQLIAATHFNETSVLDYLPIFDAMRWKSIIYQNYFKLTTIVVFSINIIFNIQHMPNYIWVENLKNIFEIHCRAKNQISRSKNFPVILKLEIILLVIWKIFSIAVFNFESKSCNGWNCLKKFSKGTFFF